MIFSGHGNAYGVFVCRLHDAAHRAVHLDAFLHRHGDNAVILHQIDDVAQRLKVARQRILVVVGEGALNIVLDNALNSLLEGQVGRVFGEHEQVAHHPLAPVDFHAAVSFAGNRAAIHHCHHFALVKQREIAFDREVVPLVDDVFREIEFRACHKVGDPGNALEGIRAITAVIGVPAVGNKAAVLVPAFAETRVAFLDLHRLRCLLDTELDLFAVFPQDALCHDGYRAVGQVGRIGPAPTAADADLAVRLSGILADNAGIAHNFSVIEIFFHHHQDIAEGLCGPDLPVPPVAGLGINAVIAPSAARIIAGPGHKFQTVDEFTGDFKVSVQLRAFGHKGLRECFQLAELLLDGLAAACVGQIPQVFAVLVVRLVHGVPNIHRGRGEVVDIRPDILVLEAHAVGFRDGEDIQPALPHHTEILSHVVLLDRDLDAGFPAVLSSEGDGGCADADALQDAVFRHSGDALIAAAEGGAAGLFLINIHILKEPGLAGQHHAVAVLDGEAFVIRDSQQFEGGRITAARQVAFVPLGAVPNAVALEQFYTLNRNIDAGQALINRPADQLAQIVTGSLLLISAAIIVDLGRTLQLFREGVPGNGIEIIIFDQVGSYNRFVKTRAVHFYQLERSGVPVQILHILVQLKRNQAFVLIRNNDDLIRSKFAFAHHHVGIVCVGVSTAAAVGFPNNLIIVVQQIARACFRRTDFLNQKVQHGGITAYRHIRLAGIGIAFAAIPGLAAARMLQGDVHMVQALFLCPFDEPGHIAAHGSVLACTAAEGALGSAFQFGRQGVPGDRVEVVILHQICLDRHILIACSAMGVHNVQHGQIPVILRKHLIQLEGHKAPAVAVQSHFARVCLALAAHDGVGAALVTVGRIDAAVALEDLCIQIRAGSGLGRGAGFFLNSGLLSRSGHFLFRRRERTVIRFAGFLSGRRERVVVFIILALAAVLPILEGLAGLFGRRTDECNRVFFR